MSPRINVTVTLELTVYDLEQLKVAAVRRAMFEMGDDEGAAASWLADNSNTNEQLAAACCQMLLDPGTIANAGADIESSWAEGTDLGTEDPRHVET